MVYIKIKFIEKEHDFDLTTGKIYDAIKCDGENMYMVINDKGIEQSYFKSRFEVVKDKQPTDDEYINKIADIIDKRRSANPVQQEMSRLFNEMFPSNKFMSVYKLGYASALATLKNDLYKYLCKDCKECIDMIVNCNKEDSEMDEFLKKLIKTS